MQSDENQQFKSDFKCSGARSRFMQEIKGHLPKVYYKKDEMKQINCSERRPVKLMFCDVPMQFLDPAENGT